MGCWLGLSALKTLYFYFCKVMKNKNWKDSCKEFCKKLWKKILGTSDTIVPSTQLPRVLYSRLSDFICTSYYKSATHYKCSFTMVYYLFYSLILFPNAGPDMKYFLGFLRTQFSTTITILLVFGPKVSCYI